jgi:hypothetical protein
MNVLLLTIIKSNIPAGKLLQNLVKKEEKIVKKRKN